MPQYEATCSGSKKASCNCTEFSSDENSSLCYNCHHYDWGNYSYTFLSRMRES